MRLSNHAFPSVTQGDVKPSEPDAGAFRLVLWSVD